MADRDHISAAPVANAFQGTRSKSRVATVTLKLLLKDSPCSVSAVSHNSLQHRDELKVASGHALRRRGSAASAAFEKLDGFSRGVETTCHLRTIRIMI